MIRVKHFLIVSPSLTTIYQKRKGLFPIIYICFGRLLQVSPIFLSYKIVITEVIEDLSSIPVNPIAVRVTVYVPAEGKV